MQASVFCAHLKTLQSEVGGGGGGQWHSEGEISNEREKWPVNEYLSICYKFLIVCEVLLRPPARPCLAYRSLLATKLPTPLSLDFVFLFLYENLVHYFTPLDDPLFQIVLFGVLVI